MARPLLLILGSLLLVAWTGPDEGPPWAGEGPMGIVGGEETDDYPAVVALCDRDDQGYTWFYCTGTLIEPDVVLTAAHCFDGPSATEVFVGVDVFAWAGDFHAIDSTSIHPLWDGLEGEPATERDIAVIRLEQPVTGVTPIPLHTGPASALQDETIRYVGFGDSAGASEPTVKRTATSLVYDADFYDFFLTSALDGSPCSGDSGGPMLVEGDDGLSVAGVNSFVIEACGDRVGATRVEEYLDWIADPDGWEPPEEDDDDDAGDDDDDREVVNLNDMGKGSGCSASVASGAGGLLGLVLLLLAAPRGRFRA